MRSLTALLGLRSSEFRDTSTHGIPNLTEVAPRLWRAGQPPMSSAWEWLARKIRGTRVLCVKLNSDDEGDDSPVGGIFGWDLVRVPLSRYAIPPSRSLVSIRDAICEAYGRGETVIWHCSAGRERSSLVSAAVQMSLFGLPRNAAWRDMLARGYRWPKPAWL